jgi:ppGpp synthetase/RelA/SpoT-type nucleotidyltranferase
MKKMGDRKYTTPKEMKDVAGARIVGFIPSDINTLSGIVEGNFNIDWRNTRDSIEELADDRVGYRGKNYVVTFKDAALDDGEYVKLGEIPFEVQITTLLAYAWGQIEHDRNYKTVMDLPRNSDIPRRFKLISGALEILDNEFE